MKRRYGRIIGITSIVGVTGNPGQTNYAASKAGMIGFTKSLAQEIASRGITANCIAPGFIKSPMTDELPESVGRSVRRSVGKMFGRPVGQSVGRSIGGLVGKTDDCRTVGILYLFYIPSVVPLPCLLFAYRPESKTCKMVLHPNCFRG